MLSPPAYVCSIAKEFRFFFVPVLSFLLRVEKLSLVAAPHSLDRASA